jgi:hypothetical protein
METQSDGLTVSTLVRLFWRGTLVQDHRPDYAPWHCESRTRQRARLNCIANAGAYHTKTSRPKSNCPSVDKGAYDDQGSLKGRNFVRGYDGRWAPPTPATKLAPFQWISSVEASRRYSRNHSTEVPGRGWVCSQRARAVELGSIPNLIHQVASSACRCSSR